MLYKARKPMTVHGVRYAAHAPVDISQYSPTLRQRLITQRRVVPLGAAALAEGGGPAGEKKAEVKAQKRAVKQAVTARKRAAPKKKAGRMRPDTTRS